MINKKFIILLFILSGIINANSANIKIEKIAIFDLNKVITVVFSGKSNSIQDFNKDKESFQKELDRKKDYIRKVEDKKKNETDAMQRTQLEKQIDELKTDYTNYYKKRNSELEEKKKKMLGTILDEIYGVVRKIAETEGYTIVLNYDPDTVFYYAIENDITGKVIEHFEKLNKQ